MPVPVPTSSTVEPDVTPASAARSRAGSAKRGACTRSYVEAVRSYERQSSMRHRVPAEPRCAVPDTLMGHVEGAPVTGFAGVFALILAETVAGSSVLTWATPLWNETKRSFFSVWSVIMVLLFAWPAWLAARSAAIPGDADGTRAVQLTRATAGALTLATVLLLARRKWAGRVVAIVATILSIGALAAM